MNRGDANLALTSCGPAPAGVASQRRVLAGAAALVLVILPQLASGSARADEGGYTFDVEGVPIYTDLRGYVEFAVEDRTEGGSVFLTINVPIEALGS